MEVRDTELMTSIKQNLLLKSHALLKTVKSKLKFQVKSYDTVNVERRLNVQFAIKKKRKEKRASETLN